MMSSCIDAIHRPLFGRSAGRLLLLLLTGASLTFASAALAKKRKRKTPAARAFATAKKLFEKRDYVAAVSAFERAYALRPHYLVQCSIARCYESLNNFIKAEKHYRRCLKEGARKKRIGKRIKRVLAAVGKKIAWLVVGSPGGGGEVVVDGRVLGRAPGKVPLNPGEHVVEVRRPGAHTARAPIIAEPGATLRIELVPTAIVKKIPVGAPRPAAVAPSPSAGVTPQAAASPDPTFTRDGLHPAWFWIATALTAGLGAATTYFGVRTLGLRSDYEEGATKTLADDFVTSRKLTNIFIALTATAAAAGTTLFFFTDFGGGDEVEGDGVSKSWGLGLRGSF